VPPLSAASAIERAACAHCGLAVPVGLVRPDTCEQFCCNGCRTAHALILEHGLGAYYALQAESPRARASTGDTEIRFADLDRPAFTERHVDTDPRGCSTRLAIDGIHCAACVWLLEKLPRVCPGVQSARVHWARSTLDVRWDPAAVRLSEIATAIHGLGYRPHPLPSGAHVDSIQAGDRSQLVSLAIAAAAAGNNMLIAAALYLGAFSFMEGPIEALLRLASCGVGVVSLAGPGRVFFRGAIAALRTRVAHMDVPIALGLLVGGVGGLVNTVRGAGEIYFDTLSVLVFLLLLGRWIQSRQQGRAARAVELMLRLTPRTAHRVVDGEVVDVPGEALEPADVVEVRAGETIPADGKVLAGVSAVDASILTGEPRPVPVEVGSRVAAGTLNVAATLRVEIESVGADTRIGRVLELVESAAQERPRIVELADRLAGRFVIAVIGLAALTFAVWMVLDPGVAIDRAVTLLIVSCPCALALATPLAISVALGRSARRRILVKSGDVFQRLMEPGTIWLDKTGTLTQGRMTMTRWIGDAEIAPAVAALEEHSSHPVAVALAVALKREGRVVHDVQDVQDVQQSDRGGISGRVDGVALAVGTEAFVRGRGVAVPSWARRAAAPMLAEGHSPVFVARGSRVVAVAGVGDPLRPDAVPAIAELRARGWEVGILSGDHRDVVRHIGASLGLPADRCHGGLAPEDKVRFVRAREGRTTVMVGDGVNDSAALAAASVGIATRDGAEASLQAAPVYLGRPGLDGILELFDKSRDTMRTIRTNFRVSLAYNLVCVSLAAIGWVTPLLAAVLMPLSSLTVVGVSLTAARKTNRA
jgi:Cu2+-exporting ATPase